MLVKFSLTLWVVYVPPKLNSGQNYCSLLKLTHCIYGSAEGKMELLEPGRRTQGVCTKETIQLSVIKPQVLLPFQGHLESPSSKWPKFPLSPWGAKTRCHQMKKGEEHGKKWPRPILFICFQGKNTGMRHEVSFQALSNDLDDPVQQMKAARRVLCSERAEQYLPMQQLCKCVRLLSS